MRYFEVKIISEVLVQFNFTTAVHQGMEEDLYTTDLFIDITKAFDTISHAILIEING